MLVTVTGFGSIWRWRLRETFNHQQRLSETAYHNTTGVRLSGSMRQRPQIVGYARFNGHGGFDPNHPFKMINRVFECADPCMWLGQTNCCSSACWLRPTSRMVSWWWCVRKLQGS